MDLKFIVLEITVFYFPRISQLFVFSHFSRLFVYSPLKSSNLDFLNVRASEITGKQELFTTFRTFFPTFHAFGTFRKIQSWDKISSIYGFISQQSTSTQPTTKPKNQQHKFGNSHESLVNAFTLRDENSICALNQAGEHRQTESVES